MEHKLHILLITLLALLAGACISPRDRETTLKLNRLERKLDSLPGRESGQPLLDSLRAIPPSALTSDRLRAHHALLLSQARRKEKLPLNQDSLISDAYKYYSNSSDAKHLMKAAFYLSRADQENGDYNNAFRHAIQAYHIAEQLDISLWIARTAEQRALLAVDRLYITETMESSRIASIYYEKAGREINSQYCLIDIADGLTYQERYKEAEILLDSIIASPADTMLLGGALSSAIFNILFTDNFDKATEYMERIEKLGDKYHWETDDYFNKALIEMHNDRDPFPYLDIARQNMSFVGSKTRYYLILKKYYHKKKDFQKAMHYADSILQLEYGFFSESFKENTSRQNMEYYEELSQSTEKNLSQATQITAFALIGLCLSASIYFIIYLYKARKRSLSQSRIKLKEIALDNIVLLLEISKFSSLNQQLSEEKSQLERARIDLFKGQWATLNGLCKEYLKSDNSAINRKNVYIRLEQQLAQLKRPENLNKLFSLTDSYLNGLLTRFRAECPALSEAQYQLFSLMAAGFSPQIISHLCDINLSHFYVLKGRLIEKIRIINPPHLEEFIKIISKT